MSIGFSIDENNIKYLVQQIHASPFKIVMAVTGGGSEMIGELLRHGSGSATVLEAVVPYDADALNDFVGKRVVKYASENTAREMAMAAYKRALELKAGKGEADIENVLGIGVTCKLLKKEGERRGRTHEVHFASQSFIRSVSSSLLIKTCGTREDEERLASLFGIAEIAGICGVTRSTDIDHTINEAGSLTGRTSEVDAGIGNMLKATLMPDDGGNFKPLKLCLSKRKSLESPELIFSGSFNPIHKNHLLMAEIASERYLSPVTFEISLANVDKPPIDFISLKSRLDSLNEHVNKDFFGGSCLTNVALFADKAILFPNSRFIIGSDTLNRLFNERYYRQGEDKFTLLEHFRKLNVGFVIYHRKGSEIVVDDDIMEICDIIPFDEYADDGTSSTKIRNESEN